MHDPGLLVTTENLNTRQVYCSFRSKTVASSVLAVLESQTGAPMYSIHIVFLQATRRQAQMHTEQCIPLLCTTSNPLPAFEVHSISYKIDLCVRRHNGKEDCRLLGEKIAARLLTLIAVAACKKIRTGIYFPQRSIGRLTR